MGIDVWYTWGYVEGVHVFQTTCAMTPDVQKYTTFIMSLEARVAVSSFFLRDTCLRWWSGLPLVDLLFFPFSPP
jgi:hypothetical protein